MSQQNQSSAPSATKWRPDRDWWLVAALGIGLLVLAAIAFLFKDFARAGLGYIFAFYLLIVGAFQFFASFARRLRRRGLLLITGLVALATGAGVLLLRIFGSTSVGTLLWILTIGLVAHGILALAASLLAPGRFVARFWRALTGVISLAFGGVILYTRLTGSTEFVDQVLDWIGIGALIAGAAILIYAFLRYRREKAEADRALAAERPAAAPPTAATSAGSAPAAVAAPVAAAATQVAATAGAAAGDVASTASATVSTATAAAGEVAETAVDTAASTVDTAADAVTEAVTPEAPAAPSPATPPAA